MKDFRKFLEENRDDVGLLDHLASEVNSYDGSCESLQVYDFDEDFFNTFFNGNVIEAVRATFFGEIQNWTDEYIRFNAYGNLESLNEWQREKELKEYADEIIDDAVRLEDGIDTDFIYESYGNDEEQDNE